MNRTDPSCTRRSDTTDESTAPRRSSNARFRPHRDSGAGAGQGVSLIVGLGDYAGGELFVEGEPIDIRYAPARFNGWKQRHWTNAFEGERFSLVWFTPLGCEFGSGLALARSYDPAG